jgi:hypothetical protein
MLAMKYAIIGVAILIAIGRFTVPGHALSYAGSYEALAHIVVGALIILALDPRYRLVSISSLMVITIIEVTRFLQQTQ